MTDDVSIWYNGEFFVDFLPSFMFLYITQESPVILPHK